LLDGGVAGVEEWWNDVLVDDNSRAMKGIGSSPSSSRFGWPEQKCKYSLYFLTLAIFLLYTKSLI